nr:MAG TPA: hypothetical protein [Caudoviricetes sp.]
MFENGCPSESGNYSVVWLVKVSYNVHHSVVFLKSQLTEKTFSFWILALNTACYQYPNLTD